MSFLGIDPGWNGYLAVYDDASNTLSIHKMPKQVSEIVSLMESIYHTEATTSNGIEFCVVEKVQGYIGNPHPGSAMFKFGQNYGIIQACLEFFYIPHLFITPQKWHRMLAIPQRNKKQTDSQYKAFLAETCRNLLPMHSQKINKANADSVLLAIVASKLG